MINYLILSLYMQNKLFILHLHFVTKLVKNLFTSLVNN